VRPTLAVVTTVVTAEDQIGRTGHAGFIGGDIKRHRSCLFATRITTAPDDATRSLPSWQCGGQGFESPRLHPRRMPWLQT
jgi:hypothetical protein